MKAKSPAKLTRTIAVAIAALTATLTFATSTPASAASAVGFCNAVPNTPVRLMYWDTRIKDWSLYRNGRAGANGCGTFRNTQTNLYLIVQSTYREPFTGGALWVGETARYALPGNLSPNLGDIEWTKKCTQCSAD